VDKYSDGARFASRQEGGFATPIPISAVRESDRRDRQLTTVIWQHTRSGKGIDSPPELVRVYKIHLDIGIVADNVVEDRLEAWNAQSKSGRSEQPGAQETPCTHNKVDAVVRAINEGKVRAVLADLSTFFSLSLLEEAQETLPRAPAQT